MNALTNQIYATRKVNDQAGNDYPLGGETEAGECEHIYNVIKNDPAITQTLEIGLCHGLSAMAICEAIRGRKGAKHIAVDPFQKTEHHGIGVSNLEKSGVDFFELIERRSEYALPDLAEERPGTFDFIFIDGFHTFDHALIDAFYSLRLLRVGGYLALDDCHWDSVGKLVEYLNHYPCLKIQSVWIRDQQRALVRRMIKSPVIRPFLPGSLQDRSKKRGRLVVFSKIAEDERPWRWYKRF